jgi:hypothetical protein
MESLDVSAPLFGVAEVAEVSGISRPNIDLLGFTETGASHPADKSRSTCKREIARQADVFGTGNIYRPAYSRTAFARTQLRGFGGHRGSDRKSQAVEIGYRQKRE